MNKKVKLSSIPKEIIPHVSINNKSEILVEHIPHVISATTLLRKFEERKSNQIKSVKKTHTMKG